MAAAKLAYDPGWDVIGDYDQPLPEDVVSSVNAAVFAADPPREVIRQIEVCIILGSRNCGYKALRAVELFGSGNRVRFVVCGANTTATGIAEATLLTHILEEAGVSRRRILIDEHSRNTVENLRHAGELITRHVADSKQHRIAIISSGFHRIRVMHSLPSDLQHAVFINATGPLVGKDTWHTNRYGRAVIFNELQRHAWRLRRSPARNEPSSRKNG